MKANIPRQKSSLLLLNKLKPALSALRAWHEDGNLPTGMMSTICQKQKSVLIIDDDYWIREALSYVLENEGCRVLTATNGQEGMEVLESSCPDIVLLDGRMPIMNGWELKQKMEADRRFDHVTVIAMSADGKHAPLMKASAFFAKPFDLNEFVDTLKPYLH